MFNHNVYAQSTATTQVDSHANAKAGGALGSAQQSPLFSMTPLILMFVVFYFLIFRPQKKRAQEEQNMLATLGKGDEVYTKSGIIGTIAGMNDSVVTLEVADGVKMKVLRPQIGGLAKKLFEKKETK